MKCLYSSFEEMLGPYIPTLVKTVLLPFGKEIIADGLIQSYNLTFGSGIRGELKKIYDDAKERGAIITTLLPLQVKSSQVPAPALDAVAYGSVQTSVLD